MDDNPRLSKAFVIATLVYGMALMGVVLAANFGIARPAFRALGRLPYGDKFCHVILVGILSFLVNRALLCRRFSVARVRLLVGSSILALLVVTEEFTQMAIPSRSFDVLDLAANLIGVILFGYLATWWYRLDQKNSSP
jgi:hypothetical protein